MKPARPSPRSPHPLRRAIAAWLGLAPLVLAPLLLALFLLALFLLGIGCASSSLERSLARGIEWFEAHVARADPSWANVIAYLHRRFGLSLRRTSGERVEATGSSSGRPEIDALYRRLSDPSARADPRTIAALPSQIDRMTALALHCDQLGLPPGRPELLQRASLSGGYALTHAALARAWTLENDCLSATALETSQREQTELLVALVARADAPRDPKRSSTDQRIEALAMLYYTGARECVRPEWIAALLAAQREDGGWPLNPDAARSDPHATALALWVLLENLRPGAAQIRWIPAAAGDTSQP